jgi:integrase
MALLTDAYVAKLRLAPGEREFDDKLSGYGVRGRKDGRLSRIIQKKLNGQTITIVVGDTAVVRDKEARARAMVLLAAIARGEDPRTEALRQPGTVRELVTAYLEAAEQSLRPRTLIELRRYLLAHGYWTPLHRLQLVELTRRHITQRAREIAKQRGGPTGNRAFVAFSGALSWGVREGWLETNPAIGANPPHEGEKPRSRILSPDELAAIWRAAGDETLGYFGPVVRLLLAVPLRRTEIGALRPNEVSFDERKITLSPERTKNKREHTVPINELVVRVLREIPVVDGDTLFGGTRGGMNGYTAWGRGFKQLNALLRAAGTPVENWSLHDLRRTCATRLGELGVLPHIVECLLGHVSGFRAGVAGTYNRAAYLDDMTAAMGRWAGYISACLTGTTERYVKSLRPPQQPPAPATELHAAPLT